MPSLRAGTTFPQPSWKPSFLVCHKECLRLSTKMEAVLIIKFNFAYFNIVVERFPRISVYELIILITCKHIIWQKCQFLNELLTQTFFVFLTFYLWELVIPSRKSFIYSSLRNGIFLNIHLVLNFWSGVYVTRWIIIINTCTCVSTLFSVCRVGVLNNNNIIFINIFDAKDYNYLHMRLCKGYVHEAINCMIALKQKA